MAGYMVPSVISARLDAAASGHKWCTHTTWPPGYFGAPSGYLKIGAKTPNSPHQRSAVLISGGLHARELAPPDALVSFIEKLNTAYAASSDIVYPAWTAADGTVYSSFTIAWPHIQDVVERLDLYVAPVVNADGRLWVLASLPPGAPSALQRLHKDWRKNRRPAPAGKTGDWCVGVDINRNFDIVWDFKKYYTPALVAAAPKSGIDGSYDPCDPEVYIGPSAESEPETQNLAGLMRSANISYYLDVHSYGRDVLYSWGLETSQSTDADLNFADSAWDGMRDGNDPSATLYAEYVPEAHFQTARVIAQQMADYILKKAGGADPTAQSRSLYRVMMSGVQYPGSICTGLATDYCFSRWFSAATAGTPISPVMAFTLEVGGDPAKPDQDEGGFAPDYVTQYPKIEREVHAAAWSLLITVAALHFDGPRAPAPPGAH